MAGPILELLAAGCIEIEEVNGEMVVRVTEEGEKVLLMEDLVQVEYDESLNAEVTPTAKGQEVLESFLKDVKEENK
jgi:predicted transcriptional regulator